MSLRDTTVIGDAAGRGEPERDRTLRRCRDGSYRVRVLPQTADLATLSVVVEVLAWLDRRWPGLPVPVGSRIRVAIEWLEPEAA